MVSMERYSHVQLTEGIANIPRKCFNPIPVEPYVEYMSQFLQPRRLRVLYFHPLTNRPRNKDTECLQTDLETQAYVREYLKTFEPYYEFCDRCMGSENDLSRLAGWKA